MLLDSFQTQGLSLEDSESFRADFRLSDGLAFDLYRLVFVRSLLHLAGAVFRLHRHERLLSIHIETGHIRFLVIAHSSLGDGLVTFGLKRSHFGLQIGQLLGDLSVAVRHK